MEPQNYAEYLLVMGFLRSSVSFCGSSPIFEDEYDPGSHRATAGRRLTLTYSPLSNIPFYNENALSERPVGLRACAPIDEKKRFFRQYF